jgi:hypothetical protein
MIGTSFPPSARRHDLPTVDDGHDGNHGHHRGRCQAVALDDRHHLPAVDRHRGTTGTTFPPSMMGTTETTGTTAAVARPWPWMMGTSFPASIGTAARRHGGHDLPAVDRHDLPGVDRHDGTTGTTFPAVDDRHGGAARRAPPSHRR